MAADLHRRQLGGASCSGRTPPRKQLRVVHSRHRVATLCSAQPQLEATSQTLETRLATQHDYWVLSDLHCTVFNSPPRGLLEMLWHRFERIFSLQINDKLERGGVGRAAYVVAYRPAAAEEEQQAAPWQQQEGAFEFPAPGYWLLKATDKAIQPGVGPSYRQQGVLGVAMLDSFGDLIPPRKLNAQRDGAVGWYRRAGIAYVSNVAVAPEARRSGVARRMMEEVERLAAEWGFRAVGLHCNAKNTAAVELYRSLGYRQTVLEPVWMPWLQGRAPDRCHFMLKRLPAKLLAAHGPADSAAADHGAAAAAGAADDTASSPVLQ